MNTFLSVAVNADRYPGHDVIHTTEERMSFIPADKINQHSLYFLAVGSLKNPLLLSLSFLVGDSFF